MARVTGAQGWQVVSVLLFLLFICLAFILAFLQLRHEYVARFGNIASLPRPHRRQPGTELLIKSGTLALPNFFQTAFPARCRMYFGMSRGFVLRFEA